MKEFDWNRHWQEFDRRYDNDNFHRALVLAAEDALGGFSGKKTLEVGSGRGVDSVYMAQAGADVYLLDVSQKSFDVSLGFAEKWGVKVCPCQAKAEQISFADNTFDLVFSQGLLEHEELMRTSLPEQRRVAKPGGFVLIDVPQLFSLEGVNKEIQMKMGRWKYGRELSFTEGDLKKVLKKEGLDYVRSYGWGVVPSLHLGIGQGMKAILTVMRGEETALFLVKKQGIRDRLEVSRLGAKILNSVGVIARKPNKT